MKTLAEIYEKNIAALAKDFPSIATAAHYFNQCSDMDKALGFSGAANKWMTLNTRPSRASDAAARLWLQANGKMLVSPPTPETAPVQMVAVKQDETSTIMAISSREKTEKVMRVLQMMGCEAVEI